MIDCSGTKKTYLYQLASIPRITPTKNTQLYLLDYARQLTQKGRVRLSMDRIGRRL
jgi:hypothetical protein